ncbi:putative transposase [Orientia tsutsugamushi str. Gilliam]|uniref:IS630 family transposase n=1 Tax=Orientia tsutsugamushi str. Gilliam TaxID=1359184 RepID=A0A0F3MDH3_ORITS|nr:putative transposase [Orientia tsutsugamushi str. Gilliam]SPR03235.1 IS630 family transposase [Orientia tsutsugamushi str. Gilliam]
MLCEKVYQHIQKVSMIAGLCNGKVIAPFLFVGNCNKSIFESFMCKLYIDQSVNS